MPMRRLAGSVQRRTSAPIGTPIAPPTRNGISRVSFIALRNFHTATPCTINPKAMINAAAWIGDRKCSHTAAATIPKAKPARPVTKAAAKVAAANRVRSRAWRSSMAHPIRLAAVHTAAATGQRLADKVAKGVVADDLGSIVLRRRREVNPRAGNLWLVLGAMTAYICVRGCAGTPSDGRLSKFCATRDARRAQLWTKAVF